jgi:tRNA threonylcarbamoyladenosine biosynthesis protein TsaB
MAYLLHIETATKVCSVALSNDGQLVHAEEINEDGYSHGEQLTCLIEKCMQHAGLTFQELAAISVSSGPGSYTGLRIGVSTAKGLCYALKIPLIAVDSLISLAVVGSKKHPNKILCPMIDARRMEVYSGIYSPDFNVIKQISPDVIDEHSYAEFGQLICFGDGASKLSEVWKTRQEITIDTSIFPSAAGQVTIAFQHFQNNKFEDVAYFEPFYLKAFYQAPVQSKTTNPV